MIVMPGVKTRISLNHNIMIHWAVFSVLYANAIPCDRMGVNLHYIDAIPRRGEEQRKREREEKKKKKAMDKIGAKIKTVCFMRFNGKIQIQLDGMIKLKSSY